MNTRRIALQNEVLEGMFEEVRTTFECVISNYYEEQGINLNDVDINDNVYMGHQVELAIQLYSNDETNINSMCDFTQMDLWDAYRDNTEAFGFAIKWITMTCRDRYGDDYNIPIDYFTECHFEKLRILFQYLYVVSNEDFVKQKLIDCYKYRLEDEEDEEDEEDTD